MNSYELHKILKSPHWIHILNQDQHRSHITSHRISSLIYPYNCFTLNTTPAPNIKLICKSIQDITHFYLSTANQSCPQHSKGSVIHRHLNPSLSIVTSFFRSLVCQSLVTFLHSRHHVTIVTDIIFTPALQNTVRGSVNSIILCLLMELHSIFYLHFQL